MNATPATVARQINVARKVNRVQPDRLAYRSETGRVNVRPARAVVVDEQPFCFVCGRLTDHWGEHDDMVDAGTARYESDGSVYPVPWKWDS